MYVCVSLHLRNRLSEGRRALRLSVHYLLLTRLSHRAEIPGVSDTKPSCFLKACPARGCGRELDTIWEESEIFLEEASCGNEKIFIRAFLISKAEK